MRVNWRSPTPVRELPPAAPKEDQADAPAFPPRSPALKNDQQPKQQQGNGGWNKKPTRKGGAGFLNKWLPKGKGKGSKNKDKAKTPPWKGKGKGTKKGKPWQKSK